MTDTVAAAATSSTDTTRGRTRITSRALERVVAAVAGDALGVPARSVDTELTDHGGSLDLELRAPIAVISIARQQHEPRALDRSGGSVLERCAAAEHLVRDRIQAITGYRVHRVTVRLTDIHITQQKRVQ